MFADLCVGVDSQREVVSSASKLGFDCVAVSSTASGRLTEADRCNIRSLVQADLEPTMPGLQHALRVNSRGSWSHNPGPMQQLTRLTFQASDHLQAQVLAESADITSSYDILAIQPQSERALKQVLTHQAGVLLQACTTLDVDIIVIDLSQRLSFKLRPQIVQAAVKRGIHFEIAYNSALRDGSTRYNFFNNAQALVKATNARGLILSSGARAGFEVRGAFDVINMATLMGLNQKQAKEAITINCVAVITHSRKRKLHKSGVKVLQGPEAAKELGEDAMQT